MISHTEWHSCGVHWSFQFHLKLFSVLGRSINYDWHCSYCCVILTLILFCDHKLIKTFFLYFMNGRLWLPSEDYRLQCLPHLESCTFSPTNCKRARLSFVARSQALCARETCLAKLNVQRIAPLNEELPCANPEESCSHRHKQVDRTEQAAWENRWDDNTQTMQGSVHLQMIFALWTKAQARSQVMMTMVVRHRTRTREEQIEASRPQKTICFNLVKMFFWHLQNHSGTSGNCS